MSDIEELPPPLSEPSAPPSGGEQTISPHSLLDDYMIILSNPSTICRQIILEPDRLYSTINKK